MGPAFDGLSKLSRSLDSRNENLAGLLKSAADVTTVLGQRSQQLNTLILNANYLLGVLNDRREAIVDLLANTAAVSAQLTGLVHDNEDKLAPTLQRLNSVVAVLEKNKDNIAAMLPNVKSSSSPKARRWPTAPTTTPMCPTCHRRVSSSRSWIMRSASGAASTQASRPTLRARAPSCRCRTTVFRKDPADEQA